MPLPQVVAFYLGIPLLMATMYGLNHAGLARHFTIAQGVPYWAGIWIPLWLLLDACSRGTALALRPWSPPLWLVLLIGATLAAFASRPYVSWYVPLFRDWLPDGAPSQVPTLAGSWRQLDVLLAFTGVPLFWMTINYYYDRVLGVPRYRGRLLELRAAEEAPAPATVEAARPIATEPPAETAKQSVGSSRERSPATSPTATTGAPPALSILGTSLVALLPTKVGTEIIALQAEDHYVRVYTNCGSALVRYRFRDAISDLEPLDGLQVHRSFWVRLAAVERVNTSSSAWLITLAGGQQVPVSEGFRTVVRNSRLPIKGT